MDIREYFKEAVAEAKRPSSERGGIFHSCSISEGWFTSKHGHYRHLTDTYIDNLPEDKLKQELALFIAYCYRQR